MSELSEVEMKSSKLLQAEELFEQKKYSQCFRRLIDISNSYSKNLRFLRIMEAVQLELKDFTAREKTLKCLVELGCENQDKLSYIDQLVKNGRYNQALDVALELQAQRLTLTQILELNKSLLLIYVRENDIEGIEEVLQSYEKIGFKSEYYFYGKSVLELGFGLEDEALASLRSALNLNAKLDSAWVALALLHEKRGDRELALGNMEKALDENPYNAVAVKCFSSWKSQEGFFEAAAYRIEYYLRHFCFDEDLTLQRINLLKKMNRHDIAHCENIKLMHFFGQKIAV